MNRIKTTVAIIGGGKACRELLSMIEADPRQLGLEVVGVADPDPDSPGLRFAREIGVPLVVDDYHEFFVRSDIELVIELTGLPQVRDEIFRNLPAHIHIVDHHASRFFWDLFARAEESRELRQRSRDQLQAERNRLRNILDSLPYEILVVDRDYRVELANRTYLDNNDFSREEVVGRRCYDLNHLTKPPCDLESGTCPHAESLTAGHSISRVVSRLDDQGRERFASVSAAPLRDEHGTIQGVVEAIRDITERMEIQRKLLQQSAQLSEARQLLDGILANSRDIIFIADAEGRLLTVNDGAVRALGYPAEALLGRPFSFLGLDPDPLEELMEAVQREGHALGYELRLRHAEGETVLVNLSLTTYGQPGLDAEIIGIGRDITTRVQLQEKVFRTEQLAAVGRMAAGVAHEINNPLAVIDTIAGLVEDTLEDEGERLDASAVANLQRAIGRLRHQVKRATSITHSLLGFVRKDGSGRRPVDLVTLMDETLDLLAPEINTRGVQVRRSYLDNIPEPVTDRMLLQQVFVNLLKNAIDAMEEKGTSQPVLEVGLERPDDRTVAVYVQDNGVGIPAEARARIFDLFHTSKPVGKGTGLGLAIVMDIVKRLDGVIDLESEPGQGTRFTVSFPVAPESVTSDH
ncbi:MAG: PAS domain-containing protein [Candidatus Krumholzibacteriia bacterium]